MAPSAARSDSGTPIVRQAWHPESHCYRQMRTHDRPAVARRRIRRASSRLLVVKVLARRPSMPSRATVNISSSPSRNEAAPLGRPYPVVQQGISRYAARCRDRVVERLDPLGVHPRLLFASIALGKDTHREPVRPAMAAERAKLSRASSLGWSLGETPCSAYVLDRCGSTDGCPCPTHRCLVMTALMPGQDFYLPFRLLRGRVEARVKSRVKGGRRPSRSDGKRS